jgi:HEAT repeat protein
MVGLFLCGGAIRTNAQEAVAPFDRSSRILKFGAIDGVNDPTKVDAVHALGLLGDPRAIPLLVEHLENESNDHLRLQIVRALGWIGSDIAVPALEKALKDKYPFVRQQSAVALKKITGKEFEFDKTGLPDPAKMRELLEKAREERKKG